MPRFVVPFVLAALIAGTSGALAVDNVQVAAPHDMVAIRAKIKAKDYKAAIRDLDSMVNRGVQDADVYNLLGFSLRKDGDLTRAMTFYKKALDYNPNHKGALEYQGELFLQINDRPMAEQNLGRLKKLCPSGCEELADLEEAMKASPAKR